MLHNRHVVHRPEPRRVLTREELAKKPAPVVPEPTVVTVIEKKEVAPAVPAESSYSKVTPIYVTPRVGKVSASKLHAHGPVMDVAGKRRPKPQHSQQLHKQAEPAKPAKHHTSHVVHNARTTKDVIDPVSQYDFDLLMEAELAGENTINLFEIGSPVSVGTSPDFKKAGHHKKPAHTSDSQKTKERTTEHLKPLPSHRLTSEERSILQQQFQEAARIKSKQAQRKSARRQVAKKAGSPRTILAVVLAGVLLSGVYATIDSFNLNQQTREVLAQPATSTEVADASAVLGEVTDGASTAPTTLGGSDYTVAADLAKFIRIPKLSVDAPVVSVGLTPEGAVDTPRNIWEAAWYNGSAKPGKIGQTFINGHASSTDGALFGKLEALTYGDEIQIERGDGTLLNYRVRHVEVLDRHDVDMTKVLQSWNGSSRGLTLLTCDGEWIPSEQTLANRVIVWADQV